MRSPRRAKLIYVIYGELKVLDLCKGGMNIHYMLFVRYIFHDIQSFEGKRKTSDQGVSQLKLLNMRNRSRRVVTWQQVYSRFSRL